MTLNKEDRSTLIKYRLKQADETIADAKLLIENNRLHAAVNRIYYGMFYSLLALALEHKFESSKHAQVLAWFNKNFVHKGKVDENLGKMTELTQC